MATQKLTKAQQGILDVLRTGTYLAYDKKKGEYWWGGYEKLRAPNKRSVKVLLDLGLIKQLPKTTGYHLHYGLNTDNAS